MDIFEAMKKDLSGTIVYHGDDFNTTKLDPKRMNSGNNQEGIGIYFGSLEVAKHYGKNIVMAKIDPSKFVESRDSISDFLSVQRIAALMKEMHKTDEDDAIYYYLTDFGIDLDPEDVGDDQILYLAKQIKDEEVRNFQIDMAERFDVESFVAAWNKLVPEIHGTYSKDTKFYAIIKTDTKVDKA